MTTLNAEVAQVNENAGVHEGIEANDLAGLLTRFEEATNSVDDIAVPSGSYQRKRILMKAKSAGNSPAITPPATPPPFFSRQNNTCLKPQRIGQKSLLVKNQSKPLQFALVVPSSVVQSQTSGISSPARLPSTTSSPQLLPQSPAIIVQPKALLQNTQATKVSMHAVPSGQIKGARLLHDLPSSTVFIKHAPQAGALELPGMPVLVASTSATLSLSPATNVPIHGQYSGGVGSKKIVMSSSTSSNSIVPQAPTQPKPINLLSMPIIDAGPQQVKKEIPDLQLIPKIKPSTPSNDPVKQVTKPVKPAATPTASHQSAVVLKTLQMGQNLPISSGGSPLLQSMLLNHSTSLMTSKLTSTSVFSQKKGPLTQTKTIETNANPTTSVSSKKGEVQSPVIMETPLSTQVGISTSSETANVAVSHDGGTTIGEHAYCSSPTASCIFHDHSENFVPSQDDLIAEVVDVKSSNEKSVDVSNPDKDAQEMPKCMERPGENSSLILNEFVLEEGEIQVDPDGNDILNPNICSPPTYELDAADDCSAAKAVSFGKTNAVSLSRRGRRYRRRAEFSSSPIREDKSTFFDKIPSHYTVLSIPAKPMKTTAFESTTKSIGSTDHLELSNFPEVSTEEGQYDKVPGYRSIFTNTTKELNILSEKAGTSKPIDEDEEEETYAVSHRSSSQHSHRSRSSQRSHRSGSRNSSCGRSGRSCSRSPDSRRGRPLSRSGRRRRSSSQLSSCSSASNSSSSGSYCSTCGASLSRSRSRSCSSGGSRERSFSRSRSRSPAQERDRQMRRRRKLRSYSPESRGFRSRSRSRSRSFSPARYQTMRSDRSRRHRTKSRSSAERKLMERRKEREEEKIKAMEERRVVYVGKIPEGYTKTQLRKRFERFGEIKAVKINFREHGDNYGFITFSYTCDAIAAKEKGNNIPGEQKFDLCFGGRRRFCPDQYADLDGNREIEEEYAPMPKKLTEELDYASLLKQHLIQQKKKR